MPGQRLVFQRVWHMVGLLMVLPGWVQRAPCRPRWLVLECCHSGCVFWPQSLGHLLMSLALPLATMILARIPLHQLSKGSVWVRGMSSGLRLLGPLPPKGSGRHCWAPRKATGLCSTWEHSRKPSCVSGLFQCQCQLPWWWHSGAPSIPMAWDLPVMGGGGRRKERQMSIAPWTSLGTGGHLKSLASAATMI